MPGFPDNHALLWWLLLGQDQLANLQARLGLDQSIPVQFGIWFGIIVLIVVEVGLITPPMGLVLFVVTLILNIIALHVVRKYREQYE